MKLICLIIGTILAVLFILKMKQGAKYEYLVENVDEETYTLKDLYIVGLAWQDNEIFRLKDNVGEKLRKDTLLLYSRKYSEFYSRIIWAQVITYAHLFLTLTFLLIPIFPEDMKMIYLLAGLGITVFSAYYAYSFVGNKVTERCDECESEFPNAISKMALIVNSGVILNEAWEMIATGKEGTFYDLMKQACDEMRNGKSEIDAISDFGMKTNSDEIKKFTSALVQIIERGGGDLPAFLENQSAELWVFKRQYMLQKGEKAAGTLLAPVVLMFVGVILIVMTAAMGNISF